MNIPSVFVTIFEKIILYIANSLHVFACCRWDYIMVSSSASRSRSARRSPSRREEARADTKATERKEAKEPAAAPESAAPAGTADRDQQEHDQEWPQDKKTSAAPAARTRSTGGGAVRNRRMAGTPGTYECPECYRVIQDNKTARDQHWESRYCRAARLYNRGYGSKEQCLDLADHEINKAWQKWSAGYGVNLKERPNEPKGLPPKGNSPSGHDGQRRHDRQRERGRSPAGSYRRHSERRKEADSERMERPRRERRRADSRDEYVKVTVEKEFHGAAAANERPKKAKKDGSKKDGNHKAKGRSVAGPDAADSEEYTYTYEESSASEEDTSPKDKSAAVEAAKKTAEKPRHEKKQPAMKQPAVAAKAKAGGPAHEPPGSEQRRLAAFNSLLRTAMETASNCGF